MITKKSNTTICPAKNEWLAGGDKMRWGLTKAIRDAKTHKRKVRIVMKCGDRTKYWMIDPETPSKHSIGWPLTIGTLRKHAYERVNAEIQTIRNEGKSARVTIKWEITDDE